MQNAQNTAEIQQRVINLVELYRTKVGKGSIKAKELAEDYKAQYDREIEEAYELSQKGGMVLDIQISEDDIDYLRTNEQLLGFFYQKVAGENAEQDVLDQLLPEVYDKTIFTEDEETFLKSHFKEMVNYIIQTPCDDIDCIDRDDEKDWQLIPEELLHLVKNRVDIPVGSTIYNPFTGFAQIPLIYPDCKFICEDSYASYTKRYNTFSEKCLEESNIRLGKGEVNLMTAWMKIVLFANSIDSTVIVDSQIPVKYDAVISFIPWIPNAIPEQVSELHSNFPSDAETIKRLFVSYDNLSEGGIFALVLPKEHLWASNSFYSLRPLWEKLIKDNSLTEIIQLPSVMSKNNLREDFCMLIAKKGRKYHKTTLIDARFAGKKTNHKNFKEVLDLLSFEEMLGNCGKEGETGLRKMVSVPTQKLNVEFLVPQAYVVEKPLDEEKPQPLSKFGTLASTRISTLKFNLPEDTPWVELNDLSNLFKGELDVSTIKKAECPNNPEYVEGSEDYGFSTSGNFIDNFLAQLYTKKGGRVYNYRRCTYLDGSKDAVLFRSSQSGIDIAIVRGAKTPMAIGFGIKAFVLNDGVDALTLVAILRLPIVHRQIQAYTEFGLDDHLDDILVPTDKRIISDEFSRMKKEMTVIANMRSNYTAEQEKYKSKLENYQHTMRKHSQQISSAVRRMERFINDMDSSEEVKKFLNDRLAVIKTHRLYLSEDVERLNEENTYGEASPFDIDYSLRNYREYFGADVCSIKYTNNISNDAIRQYRKEHQEELKKLDEKSRNKRLEAALAESSLAYVDIAEYNFGKIVRNILENAKKHGFDDFTYINSKDCVIEIALNWDKERQMYRIDFRNNGNPLPEGLTKESYGENRKYAGKTGGTGIGGYEVAENVRHYNGDYSISQDGDWITVSIYLPKSRKYGERL
ncbi:MAG: GHKL domain-containing protein [Prevotella sp.]|nr:GHKL domain-containing protein [Prevotella sp.]